MRTFVLGPGDVLVKITLWFDKKDGGLKAMTLLSHSGNTMTFGDLVRVPKREREHVLNAPAGHSLFALFGASSARRIGLTNFGVYHRAANLQSADQMALLKQLRKRGHAGAYLNACVNCLLSFDVSPYTQNLTSPLAFRLSQEVGAMIHADLMIREMLLAL
jgi:hypothetical protein